MDEQSTKHSVSLSELAELKAKVKREITEVEVFVEQCSSLYNLILDALHDPGTHQELSLQCSLLEEMATRVERAGDRLSEQQPNTEGTVQLRMNTISSALEQLRLRRGGYNGHSTDSESTTSRGSGVGSEMRNWLQSVEKRLGENEEKLHHGSLLIKLLADQQVLQLEIQSDGQAYICRLEQHLKGDPLLSPQSIDSCGNLQSDRRRLFADSLRKRWHAAYLNSLSLQIRIEEALASYSDEWESDCDPDVAAPPLKRARRWSLDQLKSGSESEEEEDTFPFAPSEYESIMDAPGTTTAAQSDSASDVENGNETRNWGSTQKDVGYSSGENSIPEALNHVADQEPEEELPRRKIDCSPCKSFYRTVPLDTDASDCELLKSKNEQLLLPEEALLSDSMIVNYDTMNSTVHENDFDEVLKLMDDDCKMSDSFHTEWREIRADAQRRRSRSDRHSILNSIMLGKASCDASSEDSSDFDGMMNRDEDNDENFLENSPMNRSMISNVTIESTPTQFGSLKRGRSQRGLLLPKNASTLLLEVTEMDASFTSTRSEFVPGKQHNNMRLRKRLKVRRLPRSMSDGEHLGLPNSAHPTVRVSPPKTPLARSTRLLQRLDQALHNQDSDTTAQEQSDHAAYEWDDYRPPNKDDSGLAETGELSVMTMGGVDDLIHQDDDYNKHFGGSHQMLTRLITESRANLLIVAKSLEAVDDPQVLRDIELIAKTNIRQLETAVKINGAGHLEEVRELEEMRREWSRLLSRVHSAHSSPSTALPAILAKFEKFTQTLRSLDQTSSMHSLNGMSSIHTREDATKALSSMLLIQENLAHDRDELRSLLISPSFKTLLSEHTSEFEAISEDFDEAVAKISGLVNSLRKLNSEWFQWNSQQEQLREIMRRIDEHLATADPMMVIEEIQICQERMDSLETMCNYLSSSLMDLQDEADNGIEHRSSTPIPLRPDFSAELRLYANALEQLKSRFTEATRIPTPPSPFNQDGLRERKSLKEMSTQADSPSIPQPPPKRKSTRIQIACLLGALVLSVAAFFFSYVYGVPFGPHLTYVRGPPPV
ncbi:unnamed protein product, partial [Mesorhabditis belari]|uniref:KASH domain-containing protein n=1 Tax=Mesorhabditis belari TaxID=2138241 RepID=A0AAF3FSU7_9BILA